MGTQNLSLQGQKSPYYLGGEQNHHTINSTIKEDNEALKVQTMKQDLVLLSLLEQSYRFHGEQRPQYFDQLELAMAEGKSLKEAFDVLPPKLIRQSKTQSFIRFRTRYKDPVVFIKKWAETQNDTFAAYMYQAFLDQASMWNLSDRQLRELQRLAESSHPELMQNWTDLLAFESKNFLSKVLDPETLFAFTLGNLVFRVVHLKSLNKLSQSPASLFNRGLFARARSLTIASSAEIGVFTAVGSLGRLLRGQHLTLTDLEQDLYRNTLTLLTLKASGALGTNTFNSLCGIKPSLNPVRFSGFKGFAQKGLPFGTGVLGLMASHELQAKVGLREGLSLRANFVESLSTQTSLSLGSKLVHVGLGHAYQRKMGQLEIQTRYFETLVQGGNFLNTLKPELVSGPAFFETREQGKDPARRLSMAMVMESEGNNVLRHETLSRTLTPLIGALDDFSLEKISGQMGEITVAQKQDVKSYLHELNLRDPYKILEMTLAALNQMYTVVLANQQMLELEHGDKWASSLMDPRTTKEDLLAIRSELLDLGQGSKLLTDLLEAGVNVSEGKHLSYVLRYFFPSRGLALDFMKVAEGLRSVGEESHPVISMMERSSQVRQTVRQKTAAELHVKFTDELAPALYEELSVRLEAAGLHPNIESTLNENAAGLGREYAKLLLERFMSLTQALPELAQRPDEMKKNLSELAQLAGLASQFDSLGEAAIVFELNSVFTKQSAVIRHYYENLIAASQGWDDNKQASNLRDFDAINSLSKVDAFLAKHASRNLPLFLRARSLVSLERLRIQGRFYDFFDDAVSVRPISEVYPGQEPGPEELHSNVKDYLEGYLGEVNIPHLAKDSVEVQDLIGEPYIKRTPNVPFFARSVFVQETYAQITEADRIIDAFRFTDGKPFVRTRLNSEEGLGEYLGYRVYSASQTFRRTGSFKEYGALVATYKNALLGTVHQVTQSHGNHGTSVALFSREFGMLCSVFLPHTTPQVKIDILNRLGAHVTTTSQEPWRGFEEARDAAIRYTQERRLVLEREFALPHGARNLHGFEDVIHGQGVLGLDIVREIQKLPEAERPKAILVNVGGGGLLAGVATSIKKHFPDMKVIGVLSAEAPAMHVSLHKGQRVEVPLNETSIMDSGIGLTVPGKRPFELIKELVDGTITVTDAEAAEGIRLGRFYTGEKLEGGAAVGIAAMLGDKLVEAFDLQKGDSLVTIFSGGNIDAARFDDVMSGREGNYPGGILDQQKTEQ